MSRGQITQQFAWRSLQPCSTSLPPLEKAQWNIPMTNEEAVLIPFALIRP